MKTLYLVIPCYNEEEVLPETSKRLLEKIQEMIDKKSISKKSRIMFANDGSKDKTWEIITKLCDSNELFCGLCLSKNRGHQNVLLAGLVTAKEHADMVISLDADLQDDIDVIDKFVEEFYKGNEIIYGVRSSRETDTRFKRGTARFFYKLMKGLGVDIIEDHADYRLMSKRAIVELEKFREVNLFLRGIIPLLGFNSSIVTYERKERFAGISKYPLKKMLKFAFNGITSFSIKPIRLIFWLGLAMFFISIMFLLYCLIAKLLGNVVDGWTFIVCSIWLIGGVQMLSLGIIGEYIGKIYDESKQRPRYIIKDILIK